MAKRTLSDSRTRQYFAGLDPDISQMTQRELHEYIKSSPDRFHGMSQQDMQTWIWENWTQHQPGIDATQGNNPNYVNRANLFGIFAESPLYQIPEEVFQQLDLFKGTALAGVASAEAGRESALGTLRGGVLQARQTMGLAREEGLGMAREDVARIRDIGERSREAALDQAYAARRETLAELQRGGDRALDIMRLQAFGGLPGERMTREQMQSNFAATQQAIKERAGGGAGALGAIAESYGEQLKAERQLAVDRAQYQAEGMGRLAAGELTASERMAEAMRQGRMDIAGIETMTARDLSDAYLATSEYYTGLGAQYARDISDLQFRGAEAVSSLDVTTGRDIRQEAFRGAELVGSGLRDITAQRQKQFAVNEYEPYVAQREFMINELARIDPFQVQAQYFGGLAGMGQSQYLAGVQGKSQAWQNAISGISNAASTVGMAGLMYGDQGFGGGSGGSMSEGPQFPIFRRW